MIITTLVENTVPSDRKDLIAEKGLSLHIQYGNKRILFDTGVKDAFFNNASKLGVDLRAVDFAVLSHHHFDHGGGLPIFLKENPSAPVYMRGDRDEEYYFRFLGIVKEYVGLDNRLFDEFSDKLKFVDQFTEISPGVFIITEIGDTYPLPKGNRLLHSKKGNSWNLDAFEHELILVIKESDRLVVLTGCSHRGILNMLEAVHRKFPGVPIKAVIGGFHQILLPFLDLMAASRSEVEKLGLSILEYPIEMAYTGHCTGQKAYRVLKQAMGDKLVYLPTGSVIEFS